MRRTIAVLGLIAGSAAANANHIHITDFFGDPGFAMGAADLSGIVFDGPGSPNGAEISDTDILNIGSHILSNNNFDETQLNNSVIVFALQTSEGLALFTAFGGLAGGTAGTAGMSLTFDQSNTHTLWYNDAADTVTPVPGLDLIQGSFAWNGTTDVVDGLAIAGLQLGESGGVDYTNVNFNGSQPGMAMFTFLTFNGSVWSIAAQTTQDTSQAQGFNYAVVIPLPSATGMGLAGLAMVGVRRRR